jgi:catechol 2,3-dioxygenase-like lactoylglutathione lyase family enzyme
MHALSITLALAAALGAAPTYKPGLLVQLRVADLDRSVRFYTEVLGFKVTERRDDLQFVHVDCGVPGLQLGLSAGGPKPSPGTVVLNFDVTGDVEAARHALEARGVVFAGPTVVIPGKVRLAEFRDPDGYVLRLAGEDAAVAK